MAELALTAMVLFIIMGSTHGKAPAGFAPIAIGFALTLIHLISIPVINNAVNPTRSTGPALSGEDISGRRCLALELAQGLQLPSPEGMDNGRTKRSLLPLQG